jgi:hypothetical protein
MYVSVIGRIGELFTEKGQGAYFGEAVPGLAVPGLEHYRSHLKAALRRDEA